MVFDNCLLKSLEILFDVCPLKYMTGIVQAPFQFFPKNERQEAAKYMAPDVLVTLVVYGPGFQAGT